MPQQATASDQSVDTFLSLGDDQKQAMLGKLSPEAKAGLLAGIQSRKVAPAANTPAAMPPPPTAAPDSVIGGFGRRAVDAVKGTVDAITAPPQGPIEAMLPPGPLQAYRAVKGAASGVVTAGKQAYDQAKQGVKAMGSDPVAGGLRLAQAGVTAASALDPLATGPVTNVNKLEAEGRNSEAIGQGAFDILGLALGSKIGKAPATRTRVANLTSMTGGGAAEYEHVLPDIDETVKANGVPKTPKDVLDTLEKTSKGIDQEFNTKLYPVASKQIVPTEISNRILAEITPDMAKTAEGQAEADQLRAAALEYQKPWTLNELNAKRMTEGNKLNSFYKRGSSDQAAALTNTQVAIKKAVRDGAANIVYDEVDAANPGANVRGLKQKQSSLWKLTDMLDDRLTDLQDKQMIEEGKTLRQKVNPHAYASSGGVRTHISGLTNLVPGGGPAKQAIIQTGKAFGPSNASTAGRAAVLSMPLADAIDQSKQKGLPPPPGPQ